MKVVISQAKDESTDEESSLTKGGGQKKIKKSCNIVTTPVRLPTYPYCCTEGNFLNFFWYFEMMF